MRIAILNWTRQRVGGAESTIAGIMEGLAELGEQFALGYEIKDRSGLSALPFSDGPTAWCARALGRRRFLEALRDWKPDVLQVHGLLSPRLERAALGVAPAILFGHSYYGTCISGTKTFSFPRIQTCRRVFGPGCLIRYYPRRVGGLSPITMVREYTRQASRLRTLRAYRQILVLSEHMRQEYLRHGFAPAAVVRLPLPPVTVAPDASALAVPRPRASGEPWRLLFAARLDALKGGSVLLAALPGIARALGVPVEVTIVGEGPVRRRLERQAAALAVRQDDLTVSFRGWLTGAAMQAAYRDADLVVMPSLWPEPFGRSGLEAGGFAVPTTAFATGGIPEWLTDGLNGTLAPADPPTPAGLADAIVRALGNAERYAALREGALRVARQATQEPFMRAVLDCLEDAAAS